MASTAAAINEEQLQAFLGLVVGDMGAAMSAVLVRIGDKLGLYRALAEGGPSTPSELALATNTSERYVREWLLNQATGGYVTFDGSSGRFHLSPEQALALADTESPANVLGFFQILADVNAIEPRITDAFKTGEGVGWHEHSHDLFMGTERFFKPGYVSNLATSWIPALDGVEGKLRRGARVADLGCGHGASTLVMAEAYPESRFVGFDYHPESIQTARQRAAEAGLSARVSFEVASASDYYHDQYDLVTFFDCLHDIGDPVAAARYARRCLADDGTVMVVEPFAHDTVAENLNPVGRVFSAASTLICVPNSLSQPGAAALGAQCGEAAIRGVFEEAGFTRFRRVTETPFNLVYEVRA